MSYSSMFEGYSVRNFFHRFKNEYKTLFIENVFMEWSICVLFTECNIFWCIFTHISVYWLILNVFISVCSKWLFKYLVQYTSKSVITMAPRLFNRDNLPVHLYWWYYWLFWHTWLEMDKFDKMFFQSKNFLLNNNVVILHYYLLKQMPILTNYSYNTMSKMSCFSKLSKTSELFAA